MLGLQFFDGTLTFLGRARSQKDVIGGLGKELASQSKANAAVGCNQEVSPCSLLKDMANIPPVIKISFLLSAMSADLLQQRQRCLYFADISVNSQENHTATVRSLYLSESAT